MHLGVHKSDLQNLFEIHENEPFDILREENETKVFCPVPGTVCTRAERAIWLKKSLLAALPLDEDAARQLAANVSPHSFRPGLAGDMRRAGKRLDVISVECRWHGLKNARMYSARPPLSTALKSASFRLINYWE